MAAAAAYLNGGAEEIQDRALVKKSWNYKGKLMLESAQAFIEVEI
ncbi:hypothetical protein CK203_088261 [Vitis vinifera]|uniref:Uncharacterized protein n=1 Tax=Vitis vinifera TaxID=29760 RepID=A0A438FJN8_VITVI|nr:hypothetical protein CK203_088261 [Vitis vinifera]